MDDADLARLLARVDALTDHLQREDDVLQALLGRVRQFELRLFSDQMLEVLMRSVVDLTVRVDLLEEYVRLRLDEVSRGRP